MKLLEATLASTPCLDRGYDYDHVRELAVAQRFEAHRTRGEELAEKLRDPAWRARRWVVEAPTRG